MELISKHMYSLSSHPLMLAPSTGERLMEDDSDLAAAVAAHSQEEDEPD